MKLKNELLLLKHIKNEHEIIIINFFKIKIDSIYKLNDEKFKILKKYIDKNLIKKYIRQLRSLSKIELEYYQHCCNKIN